MRQKIGWRRKLALKAAIDRHEDFQSFAGFRLRKLPGDCLAIHRLLYHCQPKVVVEMGSGEGGSAFLMASYAEHMGLEQIISVDIGEISCLQHPRIKFIVGDSLQPEIVRKIYDLVANRTCSLILDSNHYAPHVSKELALYHNLVGKEQALIVEDTLVDVLKFKKFRTIGGPLHALDEFLKQHPKFVEAEGIEPYITTNFFGYMIHK